MLKRFFAGCCLPVAILLLCSCASDSPITGDPNWWTHDQLEQHVVLDSILHDRSDWRIKPRIRPDDPLEVEPVAGKPAINPTDRGAIVLEGRTHYEGDYEIEIVHRLQSTGARFSVELGVTDFSSNNQAHYFASTSGTEEYIRGHAYAPAGADGKRHYQIANYFPQGYKTQQLGWPEAFRRRAENMFAGLPGAFEQWMTLRIRVVDGTARFYLEDRLYAEMTDPMQFEGALRVTMSGEVSLASIVVRQLPVLPLFETVRLDHDLNSRIINGRQIERASLPSPGKRHLVNGIPFRFPAPDEQGRDHLDIGQSWVQHGTMTGYLTARQHGIFGGRWGGPLRRNPGRIQFIIPKGHYRAVHLIAAADSQANSLPKVTVQFFRLSGGYPKEASSDVVPYFRDYSKTVTMLPVSTGEDTGGNLYHVIIPIDPGLLDELALMDMDEAGFGIELVGESRPYRSYPDPISYSRHGGGLPSSVHVYAMTMERAPFAMKVQPDAVGHVWTAPEKPSYTLDFSNLSEAKQDLTVKVTTRSQDGEETTETEKRVVMAPGGTAKQAMPLNLQRYGYHDVTVTVTGAGLTWTSERSLAYLHPDTRVRENWEEGRGPVFGMWYYGGGHMTRPRIETIEVMGKAGIQTQGGSFQEERYTDAERAMARKYHMFTMKQFSAWDHYITNRLAQNLRDKGPEEASKLFLEELREHETRPSPTTRTVTLSFFPEPHLGPITAGNWPTYWGGEPYELSEEEQAKMAYYKDAFVLGAKLANQHWPDVKNLLPHGNPLFSIPILRENGEAARLIDGVGVDTPLFERLPEMQIQQETNHRLWQLHQEWKKVRDDEPYLTFLEGNFVPTAEGALTWEEQKNLLPRNLLHLIAYGVTRLPAGIPADDCADYYGEEHYGNSYVCTRYPLSCPKPAYVAVATMTRHLNRMNFEAWHQTGNTAYCLGFKHFQENRRTYVLWTVRGKRPVSIQVPANSKLKLYDQMDNATELAVENGMVTFEISPSIVYLEGLTDEPKIDLGEPDHSDSQPAPKERRKRLTKMSRGVWWQSDIPDDVYENNHPLQIARFPGKFFTETIDIPFDKAADGLGMRVQLMEQQKQRVTMPWYTTLEPIRPLRIRGKGQALGMWVKANSDWGRIVYEVTDGEGERWLSIGYHNQWNVDDIHCYSKFNFDGWRYLRFPLPGNQPWDGYRDNGTTWWGHFGEGNGEVDLPLYVTKVIVERRTHVMYVNEPVAASPADVILGDLYVEYAAPEDMEKAAVKLDSLRKSVPERVADLDNPVKELRETGIEPAPRITRVTNPDHHADGTQCDVHFQPVEGAKSYSVWASPYPDGRGALELGKNWTESGKRLRGLRPETTFYLFLTYTTEDGKVSKPSPAYRILLHDLFFQK